MNWDLPVSRMIWWWWWMHTLTNCHSETSLPFLLLQPIHLHVNGWKTTCNKQMLIFTMISIGGLHPYTCFIDILIELIKILPYGLHFTYHFFKVYQTVDECLVPFMSKCHICNINKDRANINQKQLCPDIKLRSRHLKHLHIFSSVQVPYYMLKALAYKKLAIIFK